MLIERRLEMVEPAIIGELLQPGGLRALERMGLVGCATDAAVDSVTVEGWVARAQRLRQVCYRHAPSLLSLPATSA